MWAALWSLSRAAQESAPKAPREQLGWCQGSEAFKADSSNVPNESCLAKRVVIHLISSASSVGTLNTTLLLSGNDTRYVQR